MPDAPPATAPMTDGALWIKTPLAILADGAEGGVVVAGGRIAELVPAGATPATPVTAHFDASGHVIIPGLINTHHHMFQTLTRACPPALDKELFNWLKALFPIWSGVTPEAFRLAQRVAMAELMLSGCTTTTDHHYLFPRGLEDAIDVSVAEAQALGLRVVVTRGSMDLSVTDGGLPPDTVTQDADTIMADCERLIARYHDPSDGAMVQLALAPCSPFCSTRPLMADTVTLARRHGLRMHTHLAETMDEEAYCLETTGLRPIDYLEEAGWLADDVWLAHGIHFTDDDIARLAAAGTAITHCPCSNMVLGSGHCRVHALEAAGCAVGLGVDGSASADSSNLMQEVRQAFLLQRHHYGVEAVRHGDAFRWATQGSARCIGRAGDLGRIAVGAQADMAFFTLDALRFSGHGDPIAALVLCGAHHADRVMIQGRWTVVDGAIPGLDLMDLRRRHQAEAKALQAAVNHR